MRKEEVREAEGRACADQDLEVAVTTTGAWKPLEGSEVTGDMIQLSPRSLWGTGWDKERWQGGQGQGGRKETS